MFKTSILYCPNDTIFIYYERGDTTSRFFTYRGRVWSLLSAISEGSLYFSKSNIFFPFKRQILLWRREARWQAQHKPSQKDATKSQPPVPANLWNKDWGWDWRWKSFFEKEKGHTSPTREWGLRLLLHVDRLRKRQSGTITYLSREHCGNFAIFGR